jgi:hypothetical protein
MNETRVELKGALDEYVVNLKNVRDELKHKSKTLGV